MFIGPLSLLVSLPHPHPLCFIPGLWSWQARPQVSSYLSLVVAASESTVRE